MVTMLMVKVIAHLASTNVIFNLILDESEITDLLKLKAESFTQDCHTMSRAACYKLGDAKINTILTKQNTSANKHLYNGAVSCAAAVLSSNYMSVSMMLVALLVSLLF